MEERRGDQQVTNWTNWINRTDWTDRRAVGGLTGVLVPQEVVVVPQWYSGTVVQDCNRLDLPVPLDPPNLQS